MNIDIDELAREYLTQAEAEFGPMVSDWTFAGVEFGDTRPHLKYYPHTGEVVIFLARSAEADETQLHFQLSHEVCHMLYPCADRATLYVEKATVLNEGVSTYFSILAVAKIDAADHIVHNLREFNPAYFNAMAAVIKLLSVDSGAVRTLRLLEPRLNRLRSEHFIAAGLDLPEHTVSELLQDFA